MKADRNFRRNGSADAEEVFKRATKLAPNRKSGKERHSLYTQFDEEEEDAAFGYKANRSPYSIITTTGRSDRPRIRRGALPAAVRRCDGRRGGAVI